MCNLTPAPLSSIQIEGRSSSLSSSYWLALNHLENIGNHFLEHSPVNSAIHDHLNHEKNTLLEKLRSSDNAPFQSRFDTTVSALLEGYTPFSQLELIEATGSGPRGKVNIELLGFILACAKIAETGEGLTSEIDDFHNECGWRLSSRQLGNDLLSIYQNYATESDGLLFELLSDYRNGNKASDSAIMLLGFFAPLASLVRMDTPLVIEQVISENNNASDSKSTSGTLHRIIESLPWTAPTITIDQTTELKPLTLKHDFPFINKSILEVSVNPNGNLMALYTKGKILVYTLDDATLLSSITEKRSIYSYFLKYQINPMSNDLLYPNLLSIDPTGKWLAYGRSIGSIWKLHQNQEFKILDISTKQCSLELNTDGIDFLDESKKWESDSEIVGEWNCDYGIHDHSWSPCGEFIAISQSTNRDSPPVHLFKRSENTFKHFAHLGDFSQNFQDGGPIVAFSPDSKFIIIGDAKGVYLHSISSPSTLSEPIFRTYGAVRDVFITNNESDSHIYILTNEEMLLIKLSYDPTEGYSCTDIVRIQCNFDFPSIIAKPKNGIVHIESLHTNNLISIAFDLNSVRAEMFISPNTECLSDLHTDEDGTCYAISNKKLVKFSLKDIEKDIISKCDWLN